MSIIKRREEVDSADHIHRDHSSLCLRDTNISASTGSIVPPESGWTNQQTPARNLSGKAQRTRMKRTSVLPIRFRIGQRELHRFTGDDPVGGVSKFDQHLVWAR